MTSRVTSFDSEFYFLSIDVQYEVQLGYSTLFPFSWTLKIIFSLLAWKFKILLKKFNDTSRSISIDREFKPESIEITRDVMDLLNDVITL